MSVEIQPMTEGDWPSVRGIYREGLATGLASFETDVPESEGAGLWTLQAGIFPENVASVTLHEKCGFRVVGRRERLGQLHGVWRDVLLLERRSTVIGA